MQQTAIRTVDMDGAGNPSDAGMRKLFDRLKGLATALRGWKEDQDLIDRYLPKEKKDDVLLLLKHLRAGGRLVMDGRGRWQIHQPARESTSTPEGRARNYAALVDGVATRYSPDPQVRDKVGRAFVDLRSIYGMHRMVVDGRGCLVVPTEVEWTEWGPRASAGLAMIDGRDGVVLLRAPLRPSQHALVSAPVLDPTAHWPDEELKDLLIQTTVSPFADSGTAFQAAIARIARKSLRHAMAQRARARDWLGDAADEDVRWISFRSSVLAVHNLSGMVRRTLWSILDPEIRRATVALPSARYDSYAWLAGPTSEASIRRLQAARSYPILLKHLRSVEDVIDRGEPLAPALASTLGMPTGTLRRLQGLTWQRLGRSHHDVASPDSMALRIWAKAPPDLLPPKGGWHAMEGLLEWFRATPGSLCTEIVLKALPDPTAFIHRFRGLHDGLRDVLELVVFISRGSWERCYGGPWVGVDQLAWLADELLVEIAGPGRSLLRLERFDRLWHGRTTARTVIVRRLRRLATKERAMSWPGLTQAPFEHESGTMTWLTDEDELEIEGIEMGHCVGGYGMRCFTRQSFVARIDAKDGGRSTVEFAPMRKSRRIYVVQNQARWNTEPSTGCHEVASAFVEHAAGKGILRRGALSPRKPAQRRPFPTPMSEAEAATIIEAYSDCFPGMAAFVERVRERVVSQTHSFGALPSCE